MAGNSELAVVRPVYYLLLKITTNNQIEVPGFFRSRRVCATNRSGLHQQQPAGLAAFQVLFVKLISSNCLSLSTANNPVVCSIKPSPGTKILKKRNGHLIHKKGCIIKIAAFFIFLNVKLFIKSKTISPSFYRFEHL
jgi:hypothetical protein